MVAQLHDLTRRPVPSATVARKLGLDPGTGNAARVLTRAKDRGLVHRVDRSNWLPGKG